MNDHDGLCPECNGSGAIAGPLMLSANYYDPPEYADEECPACDGTGTLAAIPTEEEAAQPERWESDEYERWLDSL